MRNRIVEITVPQVLLVLILSALNTSAVGATQGKWGRTSTATAKITLNIPPRPTSFANVAPLYNGFDALQQFCRNIDQAEQRGYIKSQFHFSLNSGILSGDLYSVDQILESHCLGRPITTSNSKTILSSDSAILLIAPL